MKKSKGNGRIAELKKAISFGDVAARLGVQLLDRGGEKWASCPFHGPERTPSFAIKSKDGSEVFYCQGCGKGGDVIKFIELYEKIDTKSAINRLAALAGVDMRTRKEAADEVPDSPEPQWEEGYKKFEQTFTNVGEQVSQQRRAAIPYETYRKAYMDSLQANPQALAWLLENRGITEQTALDLHLGYCKKHPFRIEEDYEKHREDGWILFPRVANGKVVAVKFRSIACKTFSQMDRMDSKALFNIETINSLEPVFITEGEFDACVLEQCGFRAVSIQSASNHKLMPATINALKKATAIYLAGDNDGGVGNSAMEQLAVVLGGGGKGNGFGAYILKWPGAKDANDYFLNVCKGDENKLAESMPALMRVAESTPIVGFTSVLNQLEQGVSGTDMATDPNRLHLPISQELDTLAYSPQGSLVVFYSTYSGTGKSVLVNQIAVHEAKRGEVVVSYTPEISGDAFLALIAAQTARTPLDRSGKITAEQFKETARLLRPTYHADNAGKDWYHVKTDADEIEFYAGYNLPDGGLEETLDFIEYAVRATQATRFIIDTIQRLAIPEDGQNQIQAEGTVVKRLEKIARTYNCIFILIGQSNKEADTLKESGKDSYGILRGSREIQDVAYAIYLLHRRKQERGVNDAGLLSLDGEIILNKGRVQGGTKKKVDVLYDHGNSRFVPLDKHAQAEQAAHEAAGTMNFAPSNDDPNF